MRRKDKQVTGREEIERIILASPYVVVGFHADFSPYLVPLDFGFDGEYVYVHCAREGRKLDLLRANPDVSLLFVDYGGVLRENGEASACACTTKYASVMARGRAGVVDDNEGKKEAFAAMLGRFGMDGLPFKPGMLESTCVVKIEILEMTGKRSPAPSKA